MEVSEVGISAQTGLIGLLGHPVGHSLSPRIHNTAFRHQGVDMVYVAFDVLPEDLDVAIKGLRAVRMRGANVTVPHKESVIAAIDEVDSLAARVGAVNTIVNNDGKLTGHNTDVSGFAAALKSTIPAGASDLECLVVGAGGGARGVVAALVEEGATTVLVYNRTSSRAEALCASASGWGRTVCEPVNPERLREAVERARVLVNATPVGLGGEVKDLPFPVDTVHSGHVVVDLVYGLRSTMLVEMARAKGATAIDGKEMLVMQAAQSYRLWTGLEPPIKAMRDSINQGEG